MIFKTSFVFIHTLTIECFNNEIYSYLNGPAGHGMSQKLVKLESLDSFLLFARALAAGFVEFWMEFSCFH